MRKGSKSSLLKWSNLFFLIPLGLGVNYELYWYAIILLVVTIVSYDFHFFSEAMEVYYLDVFFSSLLMLSNFILLFRGQWQLPYSAIAIGSALLALVFYFQKSKRNYYWNHSMWHILSSGVCIFCLLTFVI